jgi:hypothetical protein
MRVDEPQRVGFARLFIVENDEREFFVSAGAAIADLQILHTRRAGPIAARAGVVLMRRSALLAQRRPLPLLSQAP